MGARFPDEAPLFGSPETILKLLDVQPRDDGLLEISSFVGAFHQKARRLAAGREAPLPPFATVRRKGDRKSSVMPGSAYRVS